MADITGVSNLSSSSTGSASLTGIQAAVSNLNTAKLEASDIAGKADKTTTVNGQALSSNVTVTDANLSVSDVTTNNVTSTSHGFVPKAPADATKFLNGAATPAFAQVKDSDLSTSDITTNNVSTSKHGFVPKAPNDASKYFRGDATWASVSSGSYISSLTDTGAITTTQVVTTTLTCNFTAKVIQIHYDLTGVDATASKENVGIAVYNGSTLVSNFIAGNESGSVPSFVATAPTVGSTAAFQSAKCVLTIANVTSTTFQVVATFTETGSGNAAEAKFTALAYQ